MKRRSEERSNHSPAIPLGIEDELPVYTEKGSILAVSTRITDAGRYDQALTTIAQGTVPAIGSDFFHSLVRHLAVALEVRYAFVTECLDEEKTRARSLAFWSGDRFGQNFEYDTAPTPCKQVLHGKICYYPKELQAFFPQDDILVQLQAESYLGAPAFDSSGDVIGHLAVMDDKFMAEDPQAAGTCPVE